MTSDFEVIFQIIVGLGMISAMWRLTREVSSLATSLSHYTTRTEDHERRIRALEMKVAKNED